MGLIAFSRFGMWFDMIFFMSCTFVVSWLLWLAFMAIFRTTFNSARNNVLARDYGRITQDKADCLSEKQARKLYGDREVDRFLQHGDYYEHLNRIYHEEGQDNEIRPVR